MIIMIKVFKKAIVKFNGGKGALLCNKCSVIIAYGFDHKDEEHFCAECRENIKNGSSHH